MNIWIVVLTYNGLADTRKCLTSLHDALLPGVHTLVVDNGSDDGTAAIVEKEFPWTEVLHIPRNVGPTAGNNRGIEKALARGAEWVLLLNNDTIVAPTLVTRLAAAARDQRKFSVIGPVINYMDDPETVMTDGVVFNPPGFPGFFQRTVVSLRPADPEAITEVDVVNGCCMLIARSVFDRIGLFDERFFLYHDETDFCLRARQSGIGCGVLAEQLVWHKGSASFKNTGKRLQRYHDARNLGLLLWKHSGASYRGRRAIDSAFTYAKYIYYRYCVEREAGHEEAADAVIEGICDAAAGRFGPFVSRKHLMLPAIRLAFELRRR